MSVDVVIRSKGLFKKNLKIKDVIFENMRYGIMDEAYRLVENETGKYTVVFNTLEICRGYEISFEKGKVELRMALPTSNSDIEFFYEYIKRICKIMNTKEFERDGEKGTFDKIDSYISMDISASIGALENMEENINNGNYTSMYLFGAINPICVGKQELLKINKDTSNLGKLMNSLQSMDVYYAMAKAYKRDDDTIFGVYVLTENVTSVLPFEPNLFMNKDIIVNDWNIMFFIDGKNSGAIPYDKFIENVNKDEIYDDKNFIITMNKLEMEELLSKYKVEL